MDFIVKLPRLEYIVTETNNDSIIVIIDELIKYAHLIPYNKRSLIR